MGRGQIWLGGTGREDPGPWAGLLCYSLLELFLLAKYRWAAGKKGELSPTAILYGKFSVFPEPRA